MGTRYEKGDEVIEKETGYKGMVADIENSKSDSPDYFVAFYSGERGEERLKASAIRKAKPSPKEKKYAVGRNPYPDSMNTDIEVISFDEMAEMFPSLSGLSDSPFRSDRTQELSSLRDKGYQPLAWTPNVRYLYYNPEEDVMVKDVEGDLFIYENPERSTIEEEVQQFPKAEVSIGEKYDSRF